MPGFNGRGPNDSGTMTGKGRGYCIKEVASSETSGQTDNVYGGYSSGRRMNRSNGPRGRGFRCLGRQNVFNEPTENKNETTENKEE
ncbi:MAG: hypothetical protein JM58_16205 [Peptococcaceae bacterium BICA1-8]|nr:MAG: hypothetical protein JM58_16205 [Peptococcaceae bacterium BICA1-8]